MTQLEFIQECRALGYTVYTASQYPHIVYLEDENEYCLYCLYWMDRGYIIVDNGSRKGERFDELMPAIARAHELYGLPLPDPILHASKLSEKKQ